MFERAPFLGQVRLVSGLGQSGIFNAALAAKQAECQRIGEAKVEACKAGLRANGRLNTRCMELSAAHDRCAAELAAMMQQLEPTPPTPNYYRGYPVVYPIDLPPPPPPPPPVQTPGSPMRTRNIPEGAYLPTPTSGAQQAQGLDCPEGQYRPQGAGWCVPKPTASDRRVPTVPYGSMFSGGFFGGSQGVTSAASFS